MAKDPVCEMEMDEKKTKNRKSYRGKMYYFCSPTCRWAFEGNPQQFVK